ncbi:PAB-dependent poly(A)-specific ribonuclease subunit 3 [Mycoemilia scoparia]|uniref:PAB-dependent poly(A)-specific ribonuclease subunit 3 n=1 Tax=Mycoemilia scoparia TaxID=417184 RepID=A0A9W8AC86_9FUNG|nr:PAB-dependent poly(A)-specific ribonuclease subunit 3 [Mycoemilia scoparia]
MLNLDPRPADSMVAKNPYVPPPIKAKLPTYQRHIMSFSADFEIRNENSKKAMAMISIQDYMDIGKDNLAMINVWRAVRHPNLISVQKAFTTRAFYDQSMVVVYDFYPLAVSVSTMFSEKTSSLYGSFVERDDFLWLVVVPIVLALRRIHSSNLAYRCLNAQNVLISGKSKQVILLSNVGIFDIDGPNVAETHRLQIQDIVDLGKLILLLKGVNNMENAIEGREALEMIKSGSDDLYIWGVALLNSNGQGLTINHIVSLMASHIADYSENLQTYSDHVMTELGKELENGRFIRLMCKLNFILERPELENDTKWAETGDCYLIKLFRDYVFHQVNENGAPIIDVAHVFTNLNKLDAGCSERIMLTSRDENSCLIVSYQDLKRCVESAYVDLINASRRSK